MSKNKYQKPRGMQDILPGDQKLWEFITEKFVQASKNAGFARISTPVLESTQLFSRAVGEQTEVVAKEMYTFEDRSGNSLSMKPESTAGVVRAYIENGMSSLPKPTKLFYIEPHFRYERPQAGRYRQHHQLGAEIFGDGSAQSDVHTIALGCRVLNDLGIEHKVSINSIGSAQDRKNYAEALVNYFEKYRQDLPDINQSQLNNNILRILDSKDPEVIKLVDDAPQILDYLSKESSARFQSVLEMLEGCGLQFELNSRLVRGLDYYNDTVFELVALNNEARDSLGGGGRYDSLVVELGGVDTPAVGLGLGIERIKSVMEANNFKPKQKPTDVFVVAIGGEALSYAEILREQLLNAGLMVGANFTKKSIGDQLAIAAKQNAKYAVVIGNREAQNKEALIKDMSSGNQHTEKHDMIVQSLIKAIRG